MFPVIQARNQLPSLRNSLLPGKQVLISLWQGPMAPWVSQVSVRGAVGRWHLLPACLLGSWICPFPSAHALVWPCVSFLDLSNRWEYKSERSHPVQVLPGLHLPSVICWPLRPSAPLEAAPALNKNSIYGHSERMGWQDLPARSQIVNVSGLRG